MGMPDDTGIVQDKAADITKAATAAGKHVSLSLRLTDDIGQRIAEHVTRGASMFTISPLDFIRRGATVFIKGLHLK